MLDKNLIVVNLKEEIMKFSHLNKRQFGYKKETLAVNYLMSQGIKLLERNYHCRMGEIDLIVQDHDYLVFVEVRFRRSISHGSSVETVDKFKQARIIRCAQHYLSKNRCAETYPCRFDVIGIKIDDVTESNEIEWIRDAFQT